MTSNIGASQLSDFGTGVGFGTKAKSMQKDEHSKSVIQKALRKAFAPEFLNRIDDMIIFNSLSRENIHHIIDIELSKLYSRIFDLGYSIKMTDKAKDFIAERGYDEKFGARPLKRAIQKYFEDPLSEEIINAKIKQGDTIKVSLNKEKNSLRMQIMKARAKKKLER